MALIARFLLDTSAAAKMGVVELRLQLPPGSIALARAMQCLPVTVAITASRV